MTVSLYHINVEPRLQCRYDLVNVIFDVAQHGFSFCASNLVVSLMPSFNVVTSFTSGRSVVYFGIGAV